MTGLGIAEARALFSPEPAYLNTASYGLPPRPAFEAFAAVADEWRHGRTEWMVWNEQVDVARGQFARLVNVSPADVSVGSQVSAFVGLVAVSLSPGDRVVVRRGGLHLGAVPAAGDGVARRGRRPGAARFRWRKP